jgi:hypothetical protein
MALRTRRRNYSIPLSQYRRSKMKDLTGPE